MENQDIIEEYFDKLGIRPTGSYQACLQRLKTKIGDDYSRQFEKILDDRFNESYTVNVYDFINRDFKTAMITEGAFSGNYYRSVAKKIIDNCEYFGNKICDIGCCNGILTCFIAKCFPNSYVTGIDSNLQGLYVGRTLAKKLNISNVTFVNKNFYDIGESFDTVILSRVTHEFLEHDAVSLMCEIGKLPGVNPIRFKQEFSEIAKHISGMIKNGGHLFAIDRFPNPMMTYGYYLALMEKSVFPIENSLDNLLCNDVGEISIMPLCFFAKNITEQIPDTDIYNMINNYQIKNKNAGE